MTKRILFVDDEPILLDTYKRLLGRQFDVTTAVGPQAGLETVRANGPFGVIVSDLRMPGMDGVTFLSSVRKMAPDSVRVMLTGYGDMDAAVAAVNEGQIFRFLNKPCPHDTLVRTLETCLGQYRLIMAERELLEKTLSGSIKLLTDILGLVSPGAIGRGSRIRKYMRHMAEALQLSDRWQYELAGLLSQIGCVIISPEVLHKIWAGQPLAPDEESIYASHPAMGARLLSNIPRLGLVSKMIAAQQTPTAPGDSSMAAGDEYAVEIGGQMLRLALALEHGIALGHPFSRVLMELGRQPGRYPGRLLDSLSTFVEERETLTMARINLRQLRTNMVLAEDVRSRNGLLLVPKGHEVTIPVILRLRSFADGVGVVEPFRVMVPVRSVPKQEAA
jgi:response regulator RpfG family c-di-GMP phosphodiesterase